MLILPDIPNNAVGVTFARAIRHTGVPETPEVLHFGSLLSFFFCNRVQSHYTRSCSAYKKILHSLCPTTCFLVFRVGLIVYSIGILLWFYSIGIQEELYTKLRRAKPNHEVWGAKQTFMDRSAESIMVELDCSSVAKYWPLSKQACSDICLLTAFSINQIGLLCMSCQTWEHRKTFKCSARTALCYMRSEKLVAQAAQAIPLPPCFCFLWQDTWGIGARGVPLLGALGSCTPICKCNTPTCLQDAILVFCVSVLIIQSHHSCIRN